MTANNNSRRLPAKKSFGRLDTGALGRVVNKAELGKVTTALEQRLGDLDMDGFTEPAAVALAESQTVYFRHYLESDTEYRWRSIAWYRRSGNYRHRE